MTEFEIYSYLFQNSFFAALKIPFREEYFLNILLALDIYNKYLLETIALAGSFFGSIAAYLLGSFISGMNKLRRKPPSARMLRAKEVFNEKIFYLLIFNCLTVIGNPLTILAGFFNLSWRRFFVLIIPGKIIYYFIIKNNFI